jgi:transcriptional regulator GlxA family with amidase domain
MDLSKGAIWSAVREGWKDADCAGQPTLKVGIVLWPEFTLTALAGFVDALRLAADVGDRSKQMRCQWVVMSLDGAPVRSSCGLALTPDCALRDPRSFDYVVVASGLMTGVHSASRRQEQYIVDVAALGLPMVGLCTGGIVLAKVGLLKGRRCCVASFHVDDLERLGTGAIPVYDRLFLDDGDRITCAGGTASIDVASYLVERHCGGDRVVKLIDRLIVDRRRTAAHAPHRSWLDLGKICDPRARRAVIIMEQNLSNPLTMSELSDRVNTSDRHLERIFAASFGQSPSRIYRTLRLRYGEWLLINTEETVTRIAFACGFADSSHFSRQFQDEFQSTPTEMRNRVAVRKKNPHPVVTREPEAHLIS